MEIAKPAMEEIAFILSKFGWETRFCDLTEGQVHTLVFGIQEAQKLQLM